MKKLFTLLITAIFVGGVYGQAKPAKITNYEEVVSQVEYPAVCREKGIEGRVVVSITVDESGKMIASKFESYPCDDLKESVSKSLAKLEFIPATNEKGEKIKSKFILPINFRLSI